MKKEKSRPHNWAGGKYLSHGYIRILKPSHPTSCKDGYILEHRYKIEKYLKRKLKISEIVHHIDGNKMNNNISNLSILTRRNHAILHTLKNNKFGINSYFRPSKHPLFFHCEYCHKKFENNRSLPLIRFCSKKCHQQNRSHFGIRKNPLNFTCKQCGIIFHNYSNKKNMSTCSKNQRRT